MGRPAAAPGRARRRSTTGRSASARRLTVRLPSGDWYALQVEKEQRWLPLLAPQLPLPIPVPVAKGDPGDGYPYSWSVYRWLDGEPATEQGIGDLTAFAIALAAFLVALQRIDTGRRAATRPPQLLPRRPAHDLRRRDQPLDRRARRRDPRRRGQAGLGRRDGGGLAARPGLVPRRRRHREPAAARPPPRRGDRLRLLRRR